jgi:hypothetical protein
MTSLSSHGRRVVVVGVLSVGAILGGAAGAGTAAPPTGAPRVADLQPAIMRAVCATSACFLVTDIPDAGVGGKT